MTASHLVTSLDGDAPVLNPPAFVYPSTGVRPVLFQELHKRYVSLIRSQSDDGSGQVIW